MMKKVGQYMQALTGAYRYAMQEVFTISVVDEIKNDNSSNTEENNDDENSINEIQSEEFINDEEIQSMQQEDLDKLLYSREN